MVECCVVGAVCIQPKSTTDAHEMKTFAWLVQETPVPNQPHPPPRSLHPTSFHVLFVSAVVHHHSPRPFHSVPMGRPSSTPSRMLRRVFGVNGRVSHELLKKASSSSLVAAPDATSSIAAATAAAIAAGPTSLIVSASEAAAAPLPFLEVRGCTPIGPKSSRFEINLGQQLVHPSSLEWLVSFVGPAVQRVRRGSHSSSLLSSGDSRRALSGSVGVGVGSGGGGTVGGADGSGKPTLQFRLYTLHRSDAEWLTLGQREGHLMGGGVQVRVGITFGAVWSNMSGPGVALHCTRTSLTMVVVRRAALRKNCLAQEVYGWSTCGGIRQTHI